MLAFCVGKLIFFFILFFCYSSTTSSKSSSNHHLLFLIIFYSSHSSISYWLARRLRCASSRWQADSFFHFIFLHWISFPQIKCHWTIFLLLYFCLSIEYSLMPRVFFLYKEERKNLSGNSSQRLQKKYKWHQWRFNGETKIQQ